MSKSKAIEYFKLFYETTQTILSSASLQVTLDTLVERAVAALAVKGGSLRLVDEQTQQLEQVASYGLSEAYLNKGALSSDYSVPQVLTGEVVCIQDAFDDPRIQYREELRTEGLNTILSLPLVASGKTIGVLRLYSAKRREFNAEEIELVSAIAELGGLAIANAQLYEAEGIKLSTLLRDVGVDLAGPPAAVEQKVCAFATDPSDAKRSLEYFRALHEITQALLSTLDSKEVMQLIVERVTGLLNAKAAALRLINQSTKELELLACKGLSERFLTKGPPHADKSVQETLKGMPVLIADTSSDPRLEYPAETVAEGIASILSLPIVAQSRVIGVLRIYSAEPRAYNQEEVTFLAAVADIAGIVIMNARLYEETQYDLSFWNATLGYLVGR
ncbi:GAF domain-containing protein [Malonomonas rubra]|uniref:GAF domain-containing protein n=1 Tax=Malonomonas rubra TaxID=57040 RepID=UPI0026EF474E|nr:GAF domain-containing protein [Malonomonas rubra]